jgi:hypothetical protein
MTRLRISIDDKVMTEVSALVEGLWPGQGARAIARFVRDAIKRYLRYWNEGSKH